MELNNKLALNRAFSSDLELTRKFTKYNPSIEDINLLAESSKLRVEFITVNLVKVRQLAQSI